MELKEDEPAPDGQPMDIVLLDHSDNQIASSKSKSRQSIAGQLAASRLVKKARLPLINKSNISSLPVATKSTNKNITVPEVNSGELSNETIDSIFEISSSTPNFATRLIAHLFDQAELLKSRNVHGWFGPINNRILNPNEALDKNSVNIIRRLVEERAKPGDHTWKQCVKSMNSKISQIKAALSEEKRWVHVFELTKMESVLDNLKSLIFYLSLFHKPRDQPNKWPG